MEYLMTQTSQTGENNKTTLDHAYLGKIAKPWYSALVGQSYRDRIEVNVHVVLYGRQHFLLIENV